MTLRQSGKEEPKTMEQKVDAIYRILKGEPMDPKDEGLLGTVRFLKTEVYKLKNWKSQVVAWVAGVSFGGGAFVAFLVDKILHKK